MWLKWLPWKYIVRQAAQRRGFIDPIALMARFNAFAQPAETAAPLELLRAGAVLHARGFINNNVIQHNLDWVWPYWVERQFDPASPAFIPRAFSMTHINLTQRNWTAVGYPGCAETPIVDARGLLMPFFDSWSLDVWYVGDDGTWIVPSRMESVTQTLETGADGHSLRVVTTASQGDVALRTETEVVNLATDGEDLEEGGGGGDAPACRTTVSVTTPGAGWVVVSLRPYNPEGVSFVNDLSLLAHDEGWEVNQARTVRFSRPPDEHLMARYRDGDVFLAIREGRFNRRAHALCEVGMITGAVLYRVEGPVVAGAETPVVAVTIPLTDASAGIAAASVTARDVSPGRADPRGPADHAARALPARRWREALAESVPFRCDAPCGASDYASRYGYLYESALRTTVLLSPRAVYAGPYTYKRFWYRDAAIIIHALMCVGQRALTERALDYCVEGQTLTGYFKSQDGEWDSNGQVLWALGRYCRLFNAAPKPEWIAAIRKGIRWIRRKRLGEIPDKPTSGLLPAGFSAEHLGPNDYYYWDDFWSIAGLRLAEEMLRSTGDAADVEAAVEAAAEAAALERAVVQSLAMVSTKIGTPAMPASPHRRMDSGAIGSVAVGFPLQLWPQDDERIRATVEYLLEDCLVDGGFYHDINHSGINPYLTLHVAQCLLRAGDERHRTLMSAIARLSSETGQWPEAVHPQLGTGCMGDGQHAWAAAEWLMMIRNSFVYEEEFEDRLVIGAGLSSAWCGEAGVTSFGPAPTRFGTVTVALTRTGDEMLLTWRGEWYGNPPRVEARFGEEGWMVTASTLNSTEGRLVLRTTERSLEKGNNT